MRQGQILRKVTIPALATGDGLSIPVNLGGYRISAIQMPPVWATAALTFRARAERYRLPNQVLPTGVVAGLAVDNTNAFDAQMTDRVTIIRNGSEAYPAKVDPIDISALMAAATIAQSKHGILWVFQQETGGEETGVVDVEVDKTAADYSSAIAAWAQYSVASRTLPPSGIVVPIGAIHVEEGGSGAFTWGTGSITAETEAYHDFVDVPEMLVPCSTLALDSSAATYTYGGSGIARLGTGLRFTVSGAVNQTIAGSNVAAGKFGAWLLYILSDDTELAIQLGNAYGSLADAQAALNDHVKNPMLALFGTLVVQNGTGSNFVPGTTNLDASNITSTFEIKGPTHFNIHDDAGAELSVTAVANRLIVLAADLKEDLQGAASIQLRSGTSATPVDQTTSPELTLVLEPV